MKWENDPNKFEKFLVLDAIIKFVSLFSCKDSSEILMSDVGDFIDQFIDERIPKLEK